MIINRVIPCLLLHDNGLVKTVKFKNPRYIGDPINAIKIFNEKEAHELMFIDIDATSQKHEPNYQLIEDIASECFMPMSYGGGVKNLEQMKRIFGLGVEKIALSSAFFENPNMLKEAAANFGSQSIIIVLDVKLNLFGQYKLYTHNGRHKVDLSIEEAVLLAEDIGVGEIIINAIDRDGMMNGYDLKLVQKIAQLVEVPVVALGGAGKLSDIRSVVEVGASAAAAGSMFVFHGAHNAVLINYPKDKSLEEVFI